MKMFKKILFCSALIAAIAMTSACSSVRLGNDLNDVKLTTEANYETMGHINVDIWGIYVFNFPIFSGSSRIEGECRMFEDTVTPGNAVQLLTKYAKARYKAQIVSDLQTETSSTWIVPSAFFFYKSVQASGNVLR